MQASHKFAYHTVLESRYDESCAEHPSLCQCFLRAFHHLAIDDPAHKHSQDLVIRSAEATVYQAISHKLFGDTRKQRLLDVKWRAAPNSADLQ